MTPQEKAKELFGRFYWCNMLITRRQAKQCAIIAVDEIIQLHKKVALETLEFYYQVKQEIKKL